jgi:hypothetical protein
MDTTTEARLREIEATIEWSSTELVKRCRHNHNLPIARLPVETLQRIFGHVVDLDMACREVCILNCECEIDPVERTATTLKACIQVCSHWRAVALETSELWARSINFNRDHHKWMERMVDLSNQRPIEIGAFSIVPLDDGAARKRVVCHTLQRASHRIQSIGITAYDEYVPDIINNMSKPAPILESLTFYVAGEGPHSIPVHGVRPTLFCGHFPRLRNLEVRDMDVVGDQFLLPAPTLTHLRLGGFSYQQFRRIVQMLQNMPLLEHLSFERAPISLMDLATREIITIPRLSSLWLRGDALCCAYIVGHMSLHTGVSVRMHFDVFCHPQEFPALLPPMLTKILHMANSPPLQNLRITIEPRLDSAEFEGWPMDYDPTSIAPLKISISDNSSQFLIAWVEAICNRLSVSSVELNQAGTRRMPPRVRPPLTLSDMLELRSTLLINGSEPRVLVALLGQHTLFPKLQKIVFYNIVDFYMLSDTVIHFCATRRNLQTTLEEVQIIECSGVEPTTVKAIGDEVTNVVWDGFRGSIETGDLEDVSGCSKYSSCRSRHILPYLHCWDDYMFRISNFPAKPSGRSV